MKRNIRNAVLFLAGFAILLLAASLLFLPKDNTIKAGIDERDNRAYGIMAEPEDTIDMVVVGDSLCCSGISPLQIWKETGISSYVCGQTAQRMTEAYYMLKRALDCQTPKLVVLESDLLFWPADTEGQINQGLFELASYYFPVFEYHNQWKRLDASDFDEVAYNNKTNDKGFQMQTDVTPYLGDGSYMKETDASREVARAERFMLGRMIELCRAKNIEFLLVSVPSPKDYQYDKHNTLEAFAQKYDVGYLDMNLLTQEIGIDWKQDMMDGSEHLNVYGAERVSRYLADYVAEHYQLTDHRGEKAYAAWDDCYENYSKRLDEQPTAEQPVAE